jgi:aryl-alcohol dehydrogenase-like predicted oxidoreductase
MNYRLLGSSGLRVSEVALGAMTFGDDWGWGTSKDEARKIYDTYRAAGGNFIDTANVYTNGSSESLVGEFIHDHRESTVLATKYTCAMSAGDVNGGGNHRKNMVQALESSLRRLRTDYIDLYWLHVWDQMTPVEEVMRAFDDLIRQGKVLYIGVSDTPAWCIAQANTLAQLRGWTPFVGVQLEYSVSERTVERELIPMAKAFGLGLVAWGPLAGGVLSGKYHSGRGNEGRYQVRKLEASRKGERVDRIVHALERVAADRRPARGAGRTGLASLSRRSCYPDHRRTSRRTVGR